MRLSTRSKNNRKGIDSRLIEISDLAITLTLVDFGHGNDSGVRTAKRQHERTEQAWARRCGQKSRSLSPVQTAKGPACPGSTPGLGVARPEQEDRKEAVQMLQTKGRRAC